MKASILLSLSVLQILLGGPLALAATQPGAPKPAASQPATSQPPARMPTAASQNYAPEYLSFIAQDIESLHADKKQYNSPQDLQSDRILIAGDSWAEFPCKSEAMEKMIVALQAPFKNDRRCRVTSKLGIEAKTWLGSAEDLELSKIITEDLGVKYIYFSLGGNDVLAEWHAEMTVDQEIEMTQRIYVLLDSIMKKYVALRPDIKIVLSGYDFPDFRNRSVPVLQKLYESMRKPTPERMNQAIADFSQRLSKLGDYKNIFYIHHLGIAQYYDGGPEGSFEPRTTLPPNEISPFRNPEVVGGRMDSPTRSKSLKLWYKIVRDAFHLTDRNYVHVMMHTYNNVLVNIIP